MSDLNENKALWRRVFMTDPRAVRPITGKDYGGNSPKPYWIIERLTDEFGPCGTGWGYTIDSERFERFSDTEVLHIARITLWYVIGGKRGEITQMGQTKASYMTSKDKLKIDEDAPKKSVTDALVKCASYLGFAGDIFSGMWDDSKYVEHAAHVWRDKVLVELVGIERLQELEDVAATMLDSFLRGNELAAAKMYYGLPNNEEKGAVWSMLAGSGEGSTDESRLRSFIKANQPQKESA